MNESKSGSKKFEEINFDGMVGPTHHYAGQSFGNEASLKHSGLISSPKKAALEGLNKSLRLKKMGLDAALLPPIRRPKLNALYDLGFRGSDEEILEKAYKYKPKLLSALYSASSMWVANAGTFSPSLDTKDGRAHFTTANLSSKYHRSLESSSTETQFRSIFRGNLFSHHAPLDPRFSDEGAANHGRLCDSHGERGLEIFVYGGSLFGDQKFSSKKYPARQMLEASESIIRLHGLQENYFLIQQSSEAIDTGVFHNDVISVMNENVFFLHEKAFHDQQRVKENLKKKWGDEKSRKKELLFIEVLESECSLKECVRSYLFNSQLVTLPSGKMKLICPQECEESTETKRVLEKITTDYAHVLEGYETFSLKESMQNGGGPACLRLRLLLSNEEKNSVHPSVWMEDERHKTLTHFIEKNYRDELKISDLSDPQFYRETMNSFDQLSDLFPFPF